MALYQQLKDAAGATRADLVQCNPVSPATEVKFVPNDPGNHDWQEYQAWLALGNTPDPPA